MSNQSFADLGVSAAVCGALQARGITAPFAVKNLVIADVFAGRDVLAKSPTGSGKTLAFGVPLVDRIKATIRADVSPRHVPDDIMLAPGITHTRTGKKLEVPIKKLLQGADPEGVVNPSAVDDPALLQWFAGLRR